MKTIIKIFLVVITFLITPYSWATDSDSSIVHKPSRFFIEAGIGRNKINMDLLNQYIMTNNVWYKQQFGTFSSAMSTYCDVNFVPVKKYPSLKVKLRYNYMSATHQQRLYLTVPLPNSPDKYTYSYNQQYTPSLVSYTIMPVLPVNIIKNGNIDIHLGVGVSYNQGNLSMSKTDLENLPEGVHISEYRSKYTGRSIGSIYMLGLSTKLISKFNIDANISYQDANVSAIKNSSGGTIAVSYQHTDLGLDFSGFFGNVGLKYNIF